MQVRIATLADEDAVNALLAASYPTLMAPDYKPAVLAAALPRMVRANPVLLGSGTFYLADEPGGAVIGCGGWTFAAPGSQAEAAGLAHVRHFATHPDFARQRIGSAIYTRCVQAAKAAGLDRFQAYASLTAVPFYTSLGLRMIRVFELQMGPEVTLPTALMEGII